MKAVRFGVLAAVATAVAALGAGTGSAASDVVGQLYINDNTGLIKRPLYVVLPGARPTLTQQLGSAGR